MIHFRNLVLCLGMTLSMTGFAAGTVISEGQVLDTGMKSGIADYTGLRFENNTKVFMNISDSFSGSVIHRVSGSLELEGTTLVGMSTLTTNDSVIVFRLTDTAAASASQINLNKLQFDPKLVVGDLPGNPHAILVDNGDGTKDICMVWDRMKHMIQANASPDYDHSAFNPANKAYWADGEIPTADFTGTVFMHRTLVFCGNEDMDFPNMRILNWGSPFHVHAKSLRLKSLDILGPAEFHTYARGAWPTDSRYPIRMKRQADSDVCRIIVSDGASHRLHGSIDGNHDVYLMLKANGAMSTVELLAENTNFTGRVIANTVTAGSPDDGDYAPVRVTLNHGRNLGAAYVKADGWKAFELDNYSVLSNADDVVVDESTRGVYVNGGACIDAAAGRFLQLNVPVAYGGELRKRGPGMLTLAAPARFVDADHKLTDAPVADLNVLKVQEGSLCIGATNAVDGVAVTMAPGTKLLLNPDLGARLLGAVSCREGSAFFSADPIRVGFADNYVPSDLRIDCAILTVPGERAGDYEFDFPAYCFGRKTTLERRINADGTVTFFLSVEGKTGFCIYFEQES